MTDVTRRMFLTGMLAAGATAALPRFAVAKIISEPRILSFHNLHTEENLTVTYWSHRNYVPSSLHKINEILRDHRTGDIARIDPELMDKLFALHVQTGSTSPYQVISAYRSPKTNMMLRTRSKGVAGHSLHMDGKAIDVNLKDVSLETLQKTALGLNNGGVGYYPKSGFVHLDTGKTRSWG